MIDLPYRLTSVESLTIGVPTSTEDAARKVAEMVRICHAMDVTVEGELGHVGANEGAGKLAKPEDYFTDPMKAEDYASRTGIDALAVAVGNATANTNSRRSWISTGSKP